MFCHLSEQFYCLELIIFISFCDRSEALLFVNIAAHTQSRVGDTKVNYRLPSVDDVQ